MNSPYDSSVHNKKAHVLIVEDEPEIRELIALQLRRSGYTTTEVSDASEALHAIDVMEPDLICLDWMLPGLNGVDFLRMLRIKETEIRRPVLLLTAKASPEDIVYGLEAGADDYMTKPFDSKVLLARVKALLRRNETLKAQEPSVQFLEIGCLSIDQRTYQVRVSGEEVHLTPSEFKLLTTLALEVGRVLTRDRLIQEIQGDGISVIGRTIDTHVFGLRKKLGVASDMIETIRGIGYRIKEIRTS